MAKEEALGLGLPESRRSRRPALPWPSGDAAQGRAFGDADGLVEANAPYQVKHMLFNGVLALVMYAN